MRSEFHDMLTLPVLRYPNKISFRSCVSRENETVIADVKGPGVVRMLWLVTGMGAEGRPARCVWTKDSLMMVLRVYFDNELTPSIESPLGALFGVYHDLQDAWGGPANSYGADNTLFKISENGALTLTIPMPFQRNLRVTLQNEVPEDVKMRIWAQVSYDMFDPRCPFTETLRLKALYRMEDRAVEYKPRHEPYMYKRSYLVGHGRGSGYLLGMTLGLTLNDTNDSWFHNGGEMIILDQTTNPRVLKGTGGEDFFGTSCWFHGHHNFPDWGFLYGNGETQFSAYRFFVTDLTLPFNSEFYFTYGGNRDFMQSLLYFYQRSGSAMLPVQRALPTVYSRLRLAPSDPSLHIPAPTGAFAYWNISKAQPIGEQHSADHASHVDEWFFLRPSFGFLSIGEYFFVYYSNEGYPVNRFVWARAFYDNRGQETNALAVITHDDPFKLYVNRHSVYQEHSPLSGFHTFEVPVRLLRGRNVFFARVTNMENTNARAFVFGLNLRFPKVANSTAAGQHYVQQEGAYVPSEAFVCG